MTNSFSSLNNGAISHGFEGFDWINVEEEDWNTILELGNGFISLRLTDWFDSGNVFVGLLFLRTFGISFIILQGITVTKLRALRGS